MGVIINKNYPCNTANYSSDTKRATSQIKYIVVHYTGNRNDKAVSNCKYFQTAGRNASAHYFVDENQICQSVSPLYTAWSVGGSKYSNCSTTGGGTFYGKCTNANSISIEITDAVDNIKDKTKKLVFALIKELMNAYNIPASNIIRHFDVTGKNCPACLTTQAKWSAFKNELNSYIISSTSANTVATTPKTTSTTNVGTNVTVTKTRQASIDNTYMIVNGEKKKVERILVDGVNYIKLKDLASDKLLITYDEANKMPVLTTM